MDQWKLSDVVLVGFFVLIVLGLLITIWTILTRRLTILGRPKPVIEEPGTFAVVVNVLGAGIATIVGFIVMLAVLLWLIKTLWRMV